MSPFLLFISAVFCTVDKMACTMQQWLKLFKHLTIRYLFKHNFLFFSGFVSLKPTALSRLFFYCNWNKFIQHSVQQRCLPYLWVFIGFSFILLLWECSNFHLDGPKLTFFTESCLLPMASLKEALEWPGKKETKTNLLYLFAK